LELVPGGHGRELEQRAAAAARISVPELGRVLVPGHLEQVLLHPVVEPRAAEDELAEPVDERLVADERDALPVADQVCAERAARFLDQAVRRELDEVGGFFLLELAGLDEAKLHRGGVHALLEIDDVEAESIAEELDHEVLAGYVIRRFAHLY
jgi:hypothetical protein